MHDSNPLNARPDWLTALEVVAKCPRCGESANAIRHDLLECMQAQLAQHVRRIEELERQIEEHRRSEGDRR
jgi:hypothetical protein